MKKVIFFVLSFILFANFAFSKNPNFIDINSSNVKNIKVPQPSKPISILEPKTAFANYTTDEEFSFESQAKAAMKKRIAALKKAGITTLGGRTVENENRNYTFIIEYLPAVKKEAALPPAIIVKTYKSGAAYWREADAKGAMNSCVSNFRNAKLSVLGSRIYQLGGDNAFAVDYVVKSVLRRSKEYKAEIITYTGGHFTFESQAKKAIGEFLSKFENAGIPAIRAKAVERPDGDWAIQLEYAVKTNKYGERPQFSIKRYMAPDIYSFDHQALKASKERMSVFINASVPPIHNFIRPSDRDYSFNIDYLVKNIYGYSSVKPSATIKNYQYPGTFDFESQAKKAMREKASAFAQAGMPILAQKVIEVGRDYSYTLDYIVKNASANPDPSQEIITYRCPETFGLKREAEAAMRDKVAAFNEAGFTALDSRIIKIGDNYSYEIEYLVNTGR